MSTIYQKLDPILQSRDCPAGCVIFHERKIGKHGPFFLCHRCKNTISEHPKGGIDTPCGACSICGGLLFWRSLPDGTRFKACWSLNKHAAILNQIK